MATLEQIALAALAREALQLRMLVSEFLLEHRNLSAVRRPDLPDPRALAAAASIIELLAQRRSQKAPEWTESVSPLAAPFFLVQSAERMKHLRDLCDRESPEPLKRRGFLAPPDFLTFV